MGCVCAQLSERIAGRRQELVTRAVTKELKGATLTSVGLGCCKPSLSLCASSIWRSGGMCDNAVQNYDSTARGWRACLPVSSWLLLPVGQELVTWWILVLLEAWHRVLETAGGDLQHKIFLQTVCRGRCQCSQCAAHVGNGEGAEFVACFVLGRTTRMGQTEPYLRRSH